MKLNGIELGPRPKTAYGLLIRVKELILEEPKRLNMDVWSSAVSPSENGPACGTVGCISGWAQMLARPAAHVGIRLMKQAPELRSFVGAASMGAYLLGGTLSEVVDVNNYNDGIYASLFFTGYWPADLQEKLHSCILGTPEYATVVAERIDRFIAEKGKAKLQRVCLVERLARKA
jgi:hypothetical protein